MLNTLHTLVTITYSPAMQKATSEWPDTRKYRFALSYSYHHSGKARRGSNTSFPVAVGLTRAVKYKALSGAQAANRV